jgi:MFS transporter, AAHS family, 4-hydroxybenzoate transporter
MTDRAAIDETERRRTNATRRHPILTHSAYQTAIRSTSVGWALGVGRIGSIIGPVAGGLLLSAHWSAQAVVLVAVVPALLAAAAVFALRSRGPRPVTM